MTAANSILTRIMSERDRQRQEVGRLREGLRRIRDGNYHSSYTAETYAIAALSGVEPYDYTG